MNRGKTSRTDFEREHRDEEVEKEAPEKRGSFWKTEETRKEVKSASLDLPLHQKVLANAFVPFRLDPRGRLISS